MIEVFKKPAIKHRHIAVVLGISQTHLSQFVRDNLYRYGMSRAGMRDDAVLSLEEAACLLAHYGATAEQMTNLLDVFPERVIHPETRRDTTPLAPSEHTALLALFQDAALARQLRRPEDREDVHMPGIRIEGEELWIGISTPAIKGSLRKRRIDVEVARDQLLRIPGASKIPTKKYDGHASRGIGAPLSEILSILDAAYSK